MKEAEYLQKNQKGPVISTDLPSIEPGSMAPSEVEPSIPRIVEKLGITNDFNVDSKISIKAKGVDEYIRLQAEAEGLREGESGYETVAERLLGRLPEPVERMVTAKRGLEALEFLFLEAALADEMSGESYFEILRERFKSEKVDILLNQLEQAIK